MIIKLFSKTTGSRLFFYTPEACCGRTLQNVFIDEAAYLNDAEKHWKAIYPCIVAQGKSIILSTPNGTEDNWFYDTHLKAKIGENDFKVYECRVGEHPIFSTAEWRKETLKNLGNKAYSEEVLQQFLVPGAKVLEIRIGEGLDEDPAWHPVKSPEDEVALMQELDPKWKPEVQPHEYKSQKKVQKVFLCGDDVNDPFCEWLEPPKTRCSFLG